MQKGKSNIQIYRDAARTLGLTSEFVQSAPRKKVLLISNGTTFFIASASVPGFYPETRRWNAHFSGSKILTQKILKRLGYKVITSKEIRVTEYTSAKHLKETLLKGKYSFPILIKPDKGLMGQGIKMIETLPQLLKVAVENYKARNDFMIQPILDQNEYRILIVNKKVLLMHSKHNPYVTGDGTSSIATLLSEIPDAKKDTVFIKKQHKKLGTKPTTILDEGKQFEYHLTKKPTTVYYKTKNIPSVIKKWALQLANDVQSPVIGIDVFIPYTFEDTSTYTIIELNSNPGVNYLETYCNDTVTAQQIFEKVLKDFFKIK